MALTEAQRAFYRTKIGTSFDDADIEARLARLGEDQLVVVEVLEERLADLTANPVSFAVPGEYSEDRSKNVELLEDALDDARGQAGLTGSSVMTAVQPAPSRYSRTAGENLPRVWRRA